MMKITPYYDMWEFIYDFYSDIEGLVGEFDRVFLHDADTTSLLVEVLVISVELTNH